jgi:hypothetical protein
VAEIRESEPERPPERAKGDCAGVVEALRPVPSEPQEAVTRFHVGLVVWGLWLAAFLALELPAVFDRVPWPTLSTESWDAQTAWHFSRLLMAVFLGVLLMHIVFRLSAEALIAVVVLAVVALVVHLAAGV